MYPIWLNSKLVKEIITFTPIWDIWISIITRQTSTPVANITLHGADDPGAGAIGTYTSICRSVLLRLLAGQIGNCP
ncbi:Os10g0179000, partial [Oryza sativa Japonica Group]